MAVAAAPCEERDGREEDLWAAPVGASSTTPAGRVRISLVSDVSSRHTI